ncbi:hypothetical protein E0Z10_g7589 [Xylaria hypoxylon]|uniref:Ketosynthase family 3 (KS3) domain-containing protein n=1 Tax=Xylaria hypoxylon TaxID=37992 RepID=A0A4Z0YQB1_9PEZI|nr:hypothetical protein E0Z10_g7589 [Xylaria hypoxylon]
MTLAGGVNIITGIHNFLDLGKAGFFNLTGQCKPFDEAADGVGLVVLKPLRQAVTDGDNILGVVASIATNNGGLSPSITTLCPRAQTELFRNVDAIGRILKLVIPSRLPVCARYLGIPFRAALVSSYGAAGSNAALICTEPPRRDRNRAVESDFPFAFPVFISGTSIESLRENVTKLAAYLRKTPPDDHNQLSIGNVAVALHDHRRHHNVRWVGTARSIDSLAYSLETSVDAEFFDVKPRHKRPMVLVFSG